MSRKKRKINSREENLEEEGVDINSFRNEFVKLVDSVQFMFSDTLNESKVLNERDFGELISEEKIERILTIFSGTGAKKLQSIIEKVDYLKIKSFFNRIFGKRKISKQVMIQSLVSKFFDKEPEILKREMEEKNLESIDDFRDLQSVTMFNDKYVTVDVVKQIVKFMHFNRSLLENVGGVCKGFYITILCSWPKVLINKTNLYQTSLLVLQNIQEIKIVQEKNSLFTQGEITFLCEKLSKNTSLRKVTYRSTLIVYHKNFSTIEKKWLKNNINPFRNVVDFKFILINKTMLQTYSKLAKLDDNFWKVNLATIFPSLNIFHNPLPIISIKDIPIRELKLKRSVSEKVLFMIPSRRKMVAKMKEVYSMDKIRNCVNHPEKLRKLHLSVTCSEIKDEFLFQFFEHYNKLEQLELQLSFEDMFHFDAPNLSFLSLPKKLTELTILSFESFRNHHQWENVDRWSPVTFLRSFKMPIYFRNGVEELKDLRKLRISSSSLITTKGLIHIMNRCHKIVELRVVLRCHKQEEYDDFKEILPKLGESKYLYFRIEAKLDCVRLALNVENDCYMMLEKDARRRRLKLVSFRIKPTRYIHKSCFPVLHKSMTLNLSLLLMGIEIFTVIRSKGDTWTDIDDTMLSSDGELGFERRSQCFCDCYPHDLDVNREITNTPFYVGYYSRSNTVAGGAVRREFEKIEYVKRQDF